MLVGQSDTSVLLFSIVEDGRGYQRLLYILCDVTGSTYVRIV